jgi:GT2 family glycosyltransferase
MIESLEIAHLAVVVITHNSAHALPRWLAALEAVCDRRLLELCVADSGSSPEQVAEMEAATRGRVDHFLRLPNYGFGGACNAGAAATSAPILLFTNPDVEVRSLPARMLDGSGLGGAVVGGYGTDPYRPLGFAEAPGLRSEARELALGRWSSSYGRSETAPSWVSGASLAIERSSFDHIGGFSPDYFMYFEDADLCGRHCLAGGTVELDEELLVEHGGGQSSDAETSSMLVDALDGVQRASGRVYARRFGRPIDGLLLYLLMVLTYIPRRALVELLRNRRPFGAVARHILYLLWPNRALRRIVGSSP